MNEVTDAIRAADKGPPDVLLSAVESKFDQLYQLSENLMADLRARDLEGHLEIVVKLRSRPMGSHRRRTKHDSITLGTIF